MDRPIETRTLGEAVATSFEVVPMPDGWVCLKFCFMEIDGDVYERVRVVMPRSAFLELRGVWDEPETTVGSQRLLCQ